MITQVTFNDFVDAFRSHNREEKFTYEGLQALFDWLEEVEACSAEPLEFDVITLCCEYTEYATATEAVQAYVPTYNGDHPYDWLCEHTGVIEVVDYQGRDTGRVIVANF